MVAAKWLDMHMFLSKVKEDTIQVLASIWRIWPRAITRRVQQRRNQNNVAPYRKHHMHRISFSISAALASIAIALAPSISFALGVEGHQTVALIAQAQLQPSARAAIDRLLALEPGDTLASISTWADESRDRSTAHWHFVNFPRGTCQYQPPRDCPDGQCVVAAIDKANAILHSRAPDGDRLIALKYLVHFVGDIHQPLHAGYYDDKGGNTYQVQSDMRGKNLHAIWDTGMLTKMDSSAQSLAKRALARPVNVAYGAGPAQWAKESCEIVNSAGFYPPHTIPDDYYAHFAPVMAQQLQRAGGRLAAMLNDLR